MTLSHLYKTVVLPSALYGCELWNCISSSDLQKLNVFQHFVCKNSLNLLKSCRSDICESLFGVLPIEAEIDTRKLLFLGRLCRLHSTTLTKKIFAIRLYSFIYNLALKQKGFIPEIFDIIQKYELTDHLKQWLHDGSFPGKITWKKIVRTAVSTLYKSQRQTRISNDSDFLTFRLIFDDIDPSSLWKLPRNCYEINLCKFVCKLISNTRECINVYTCLLCQRPFKNLIAHASCTCAATENIRDVWWEEVINLYDIRLSAELCGLAEDDFLVILLGRRTDTPLESSATASFRMLNYRLLKNTVALYNKALSFQCM